MVRSKRGGPRQGTPGKGYSNRTDMISNYDQGAASPAAGGIEAPPVQGPPPITPDDIPGIDAPTQRPDEPITAGLSIGPGPGPQRDNRMVETQALKQYLPLLELYLDRPDTPDSVRSLFRYIRGS